VRFQVLTAASMKFTVFWDVAPWSNRVVVRRYRGVYSRHRQWIHGATSQKAPNFTVMIRPSALFTRCSVTGSVSFSFHKRTRVFYTGIILYKTAIFLDYSTAETGTYTGEVSDPLCPIHFQCLVLLSLVHSDETTKPKTDYSSHLSSVLIRHGCYPTLCIQLTIVLTYPYSRHPTFQAAFLIVCLCVFLYSNNKRSSFNLFNLQMPLFINLKR
jgi:hypothetical protein